MIDDGAVRVAGRLRSRTETAHFGRAVVLDLGGTQLVLTELPPLPLKPSFYSDVGLSPWRADLVVVKNFFPFRIFYLPYARKTIYVKTKGLTDFDAAYALSFADPMHPRDRVDDWRPADRRRRGQPG